MRRSGEDDGGIDRLVFFSDAVIAIAMTILVIDIRVPAELSNLDDNSVLSLLLSLWRQYLGFAISFLVIGVFWIGHHHRFRLIKRADRTMLFLNLFVLMVVALVPFATSIISENGNRAATILYALLMVLLGLFSLASWAHASRGNRLVVAGLSGEDRRREYRRLIAFPLVFAASVGIAFIDADAAKYSWLSLVVFTRL